jgi:hypothetical protein
MNNLLHFRFLQKLSLHSYSHLKFSSLFNESHTGFGETGNATKYSFDLSYQS